MFLLIVFEDTGYTTWDDEITTFPISGLCISYAAHVFMFAKMIPCSFRLNCDLQCVETDKQITEIKQIQPTCFLFFLIVVEGGSGAMIM